MDTKEFLIQFKLQFDEVLSDYLRKKQLEYWNISEEFGHMFAKLEDFTMRGGKRHRSALVFHTAKVFKPEINDNDLMKAAILMEMLQIFLLIHDDIVDKDELRRGGLTVHKMFAYEAKAQNWSKPDEYGDAIAIYIGDVASMLVYEIIAESNFSDAIKVKLMGVMSKQTIDTGIGQIHDTIVERRSNYTEKDIEFIQKYKTSKYSFSMPSVIGAVLGEANDSSLELVENYATPAGIAFQVRDDILGVFGDEVKTGKSAYSDIKQGKKTLLILKALENGNEEQKEIINKYLGKLDLTADEANEVRKIIRATGSLDYSIELSQKYVREANKALEKLPNQDSESFRFIKGLIEYIAVREV